MNVREMEALLKEQELASLLNLSLSMIRKDRRLGRGVPFVRMGRSIRYRPEDVRAYMNPRGEK